MLHTMRAAILAALLLGIAFASEPLATQTFYAAVDNGLIDRTIPIAEGIDRPETIVLREMILGHAVDEGGRDAIAPKRKPWGEARLALS